DGGVRKTFETQLAGHRQAERISPAASAVLFFARRLVGRAHSPFAFFSALPPAGAQLRRSGDTAIHREIERRWNFRSDISRPVAEIGGQGQGVHDLAGIEKIVRIESSLDLSKGLL